VPGTAFAQQEVMARPLWTGSISFGLVTVSIGLVSAIEAP
jgi:non-homologous end joining protein Ku